MHALDLTDLATTYVRHSAAQVALRCSPHREVVHSYWVISRFRRDYWSSRLAAHRLDIQKPGTSFRKQKWLEITPVIQEVLLSEPLARCLAYHATLLEEQEIDRDFAPLAHSVLGAHVEARNRCLHLIVFGHGLPVEDAVRLNRLRRNMEIYTDQLLATMHPVQNLDAFCFDSPTVLHSQRGAGSGHTCPTQLHTSSLAEGFKKTVFGDTDHRIANMRLNQKLAHIVLRLMPNTLFDSFGVPKSNHFAMFDGESSESDGRRDDLASPLVYPLNILTGVPMSRREIEQTSQRRW